MKPALILRGRCPSCEKGAIMRRGLSMNKKCPECGYNFYPENGFYLGAMVVSYLLTAMLTIPPMIFLKVMNAPIPFLLAFPLLEFIFLGTFLLYYARIIWLHLEHKTTSSLK